jgi:signal peptidase II
MIIRYIIILVCIFDRISKWWAVHALQQGPLVFNEMFSFELAFNRGISWSLFHAQDTLIFVAVSICVMIVMCVLMYHMAQQVRVGRAITGELFVLIGGLSNIVDRIVYKGVVDFIACSYGSWEFPIFNIADCAVSAGVFIMLIHVIRFEYGNSRNKKLNNKSYELT